MARFEVRQLVLVVALFCCGGNLRPTSAFAPRSDVSRRSSPMDLVNNIQVAQQLKRSTALKGMWSEDEIEGVDKYKACVPYLLPLIDGDRFGHYIYERIPALGALNSVTIGPLAELAQNIPFLTVLLFMALTLGTRFNMDMSRNLRFSAQQAAMIDLGLLLPELIAALFEDDPLPRSLAEPACTFVWYTYVSAVSYSLYKNVRGKKPDQIPYVSDFAEIMVGPF